MPLLPRKGILAIAAVVDIALHAQSGPVSARALAARHELPPRHLEPVLQALVRAGILRGIRGPRGGYELAREQRRISAEDILQAAGTADEADEALSTATPLVTEIVVPAMAEAEKLFSSALGRITLDDMVRRAETLARKDSSALSIASGSPAPSAPATTFSRDVRTGSREENASNRK